MALAETALVLTYLTLWSQLGVLTRIYLDALFSNGCRGGWGGCLTSAGPWLCGNYENKKAAFDFMAAGERVLTIVLAIRDNISVLWGILCGPAVEHAGVLLHRPDCPVSCPGTCPRAEDCGHSPSKPHLAGIELLQHHPQCIARYVSLQEFCTFRPDHRVTTEWQSGL